MKGYAASIREDAAAIGHIGANVRHIEAWMRLEHSTLDGLSRVQFRVEVATAIDCIAASSDTENESLARSFGL